MGHYPANYLMGRRLIPKREVLRSSALTSAPFEAVVSCCISSPFGGLSTTRGEITYVLLTRAPLSWVAPTAFDLHVLGAPLTFVLSQDQTLQLDLEKEGPPAKGGLLLAFRWPTEPRLSRTQCDWCNRADFRDENTATTLHRDPHQRERTIQFSRTERKVPSVGGARI